MAQLQKRQSWRPIDATGEPIRGGAGGFHLPQTNRPTSLRTPGGRRLQLVESPAQEAMRGVIARAIDRFRRRNVRRAA